MSKIREFLEFIISNNMPVLKERAEAAMKELVEIEEYSKYTVCAYCGHKNLKSEGAKAILDHIMSCEKRPEKILLDKAFEVEDRLYGFLNHLLITNDEGRINYEPSRCDTCSRIKELLDIYNAKEES